MHGYLLSENTRTWWSRLAAEFRLRVLLFNLAVGVLAGLLAACGRLHLGLPGHKALFWLTPVLVARMLSRHTVGATAGVCAAACAALALGGSFAGPMICLPLVVAAGGALDALAALADRRRTSAWLTIPLLGLGGAAANLLCAVNRLILPVRRGHVFLGLTGPQATFLSYATFGLLAGLAAAAVATGIRELARRRRQAPS